MATLGPVRNLLIVLGDQLDRKSAIFRDADRARDVAVLLDLAIGNGEQLVPDLFLELGAGGRERSQRETGEGRVGGQA